MTTYIDPNTDLPQNLGEIYSDRNIRILGQARINPTNSNQVDTVDVQILCTPKTGGSESITNIPNGTYTLGVGSSLWVKINRTGTATASPEIYVSGDQPKSRRDYVQVFYQTPEYVISLGNYAIEQVPIYTRLGFGAGQKVYDAIVGDVGDGFATHTDLQTSINDVLNNSCILVKKMCLVPVTINTASKMIKLVFSGTGTGLQANGAATGITLQSPGCQLVGHGTISGFTTGIDLNNQSGSRIEMAFASNTTNINFGSLNGTQYSLNGSSGLTEISHSQISSTEGTVNRWNNTSKRWEPSSSVFVFANGEIVKVMGTAASTDHVLRIGASAANCSTNIWFTDSSGSGACSYIRGTTSGSGILQFATGGTGTANIYTNPAIVRLTIGTSDIISTLPFKLPDGSVGAPSLTFTNDPDTGLYRSTTNTLVFVTGGGARITVDGNGVGFNNHNVSGIATLTATTLLGNGASITALNMNNAGSGTLIVGRGGTGTTSFTTNGVLYGNSTGALQVTAAGSQYQVLQPNASGVPIFAALNLGSTSAVTGTLPVASGGTGVTTSTGTGSVVLSASPTFTGTVNAATITATYLNGNGAGITNLNMGNAASGVLAVIRGGTGVTTSTGTGSVVRSESPTFTGTVNAATITATYLNGNGAGITNLNMGNAASGVLAVIRGGTGVTTSTGTGSVVLSANPILTGTVTINNILNMTGDGSDIKIELGVARSAAGNAYIDFHSATSGDYGGRVIRTPNDFRIEGIPTLTHNILFDDAGSIYINPATNIHLGTGHRPVYVVAGRSDYSICGHSNGNLDLGGATGVALGSGNAVVTGGLPDVHLITNTNTVESLKKIKCPHFAYDQSAYWSTTDPTRTFSSSIWYTLTSNQSYAADGAVYVLQWYMRWDGIFYHTWEATCLIPMCYWCSVGNASGLAWYTYLTPVAHDRAAPAPSIVIGLRAGNPTILAWRPTINLIINSDGIIRVRLKKLLQYPEP